MAASAAAGLLLAAGPATAQVSTSGMGKVLPVELFACTYIDGKVVSAYESFTEIGADFERFANGGGRERSQEIFGDIDECDDARVYASTTSRAAQVRD